MDAGNPIAQLLTGGTSSGGGAAPVQGPPQANQPTGFPRPHDPADRLLKVMTDGLKRLADVIRKTPPGDENFANNIERMALDLDRERVRRSKDLEKSMKALQTPGGGDQAIPRM